MIQTPIVQLRGVAVRYGPVTALAGVDFDLIAARVTCLLGENGAGKSTLIRVLSGLVRPTDGELRVDGEPTELRSPRDALRRGIATVHQDLALVPLMSAWRNFFLGREPVTGRGPFARLNPRRAAAVTLTEMARLGISLDDASRAVGTLSGGERQCLAIARALHAGARALILDEPTAALAPRQARAVLDAIARGREAGAAVLLVTHAPRHALEVGDRFVFLRRGVVAATCGREDAAAHIDRLLR